MPPREFLARRRRNRSKRRDRENEMRHTDLPPSFDVEAEVLRERAFELLPDLTMDDVNALADAGIPGLSFPEEGLLSDKIGEIIEDVANQGRAGDLLPNPQDFDLRGPDFNGNLENPLYDPNGPLPSLGSNGTPPHLLDPSTPSPLLVPFDPVGETSPEQVAANIVAGVRRENRRPSGTNLFSFLESFGPATNSFDNIVLAQNDGIPESGIPPAANDNRDEVCTKQAQQCAASVPPKDVVRCWATERSCNQYVAAQRRGAYGDNVAVLVIYKDGSSVYVLPGGRTVPGPKHSPIPGTPPTYGM